MKKLGRRALLRQVIAGTTAFAAIRKVSAAADSKVEIILEEPIGTISPDLHGHFAEHIGGVVYDGIWVGEGSKIPNIGGIRKALVEHMRVLNPSVVRWPGGCFADSYNWRDGIGQRDQRPTRPNFWIINPRLKQSPDGPHKYDSNHFGTHEFIQFCRLIGAEPYLAANVRTLSPEDFDQWVEYCNAPAGLTTLARERAANGSLEPFNVRFWGVGNESWGCGGNLTPEEYATEYRRFTSWPSRFGLDRSLIATGPNGGQVDIEWTRRFFAKLTERSKKYLDRVYGWGLHYYCGTAGQALDFTEDDWYELLIKANRMEFLLEEHWAAMGEVDQDHRVKFAVDEWGAWHRPGSELHSSHLFGQNSTMRDALVAALTLDTFHRHAEKVAMANVAQLINCLHSLFLAHEDRFLVTPNFHVFEMYAAHHNGQSVRTEFSAPEITVSHGDKVDRLWGLGGSASLHNKQVVLTVVNPSVREVRETEFKVKNASIQSAHVRILSEEDIHAHNSLEHPHAVQPRDSSVQAQGGSVFLGVPPASIVRLIFDLA